MIKILEIKTQIKAIKPVPMALKAVLEQEEAKEVTKAYDGLQAMLEEFVSEQHAAWVIGVEDVSQAKLKQPLLTRHADTQLLAVNFDPELVRLLRERRMSPRLERAATARAAAYSWDAAAARTVACFRRCLGDAEGPS